MKPSQKVSGESRYTVFTEVIPVNDLPIITQDNSPELFAMVMQAKRDFAEGRARKLP